MKKCTKCLQEKNETEFNKVKRHPDGLSYKCKSCDRETSKQYHLKNKKKYTGYFQQLHQKHKLSCWIVYILPVPHYAGITSNPTYRMRRHKFDERDTTGWYEVARYNNREDALAHEAQLHSQGYNGMNSKYQVISVLK